MDGGVAVVTGGGSGIGAATARALDALGTRVVVADLAAEAAADVAGGLDRAESCSLDVTDPPAVTRALADVASRHGRLDVVVHAAGIDDPDVKARVAAQRRAGSPVDVLRHLSDASWARVLRVDLDGTFHVLRAAAAVMVPQGHGDVVVVGSSAAVDAVAGYPHYVAAKAGVHALAQSAAKELAPHGVRVNVVAPGSVDTPLLQRTQSLMDAFVAPGEVLRVATATEIADSIAHLALARSRDVVGAVLLSNGGRFTR